MRERPEPRAEVDVAVVGGGPAGLAAAIACAARGARVTVFDRRAPPLDKACGEGVMPAGVAALGRLGAWPFVRDGDRAPVRGLRFIQEDGAFAEGAFARGGVGFGVRRIALVDALVARARQLAVDLRWTSPVTSWDERIDSVRLETAAGPVLARVVVIATGINGSPRRTAAAAATARFGARRHYRIAPWSDLVEVHWSDGVEAYVTPAGADRVGVALLWDRDRLDGAAAFEALLARFPALRSRLFGAPHDSEVRGAGPLGKPLRRRLVEGRLVFIGDAAGAVDPITGEGLSLALLGAEAMGAAMPGALGGELRRELSAYSRRYRVRFERANALAAVLLGASRRPGLRRAAFGLIGRAGFFEPLMQFASA